MHLIFGMQFIHLTKLSEGSNWYLFFHKAEHVPGQKAVITIVKSWYFQSKRQYNQNYTAITVVMQWHNSEWRQAYYKLLYNSPRQRHI